MMDDAKCRFHVGQLVVCKDNVGCGLDLLRCYTVRAIVSYKWPQNSFNLYLKEDASDNAYVPSRFEDYDTWASHQKPVDDATDLALTKVQINSLQEFKKDAIEREKKLAYTLERLTQFVQDIADCQYCSLNDLEQVAGVVLEELKL